MVKNKIKHENLVYSLSLSLSLSLDSVRRNEAGFYFVNSNRDNKIFSIDRIVQVY